MRRFAIPCLLFAVAASNPASARQLGAELGLRSVQIPANLFVAPPASFTESPGRDRSAKRMADMFKTNGSPDASDIIDLIRWRPA